MHPRPSGRGHRAGEDSQTAAPSGGAGPPGGCGGGQRLPPRSHRVRPGDPLRRVHVQPGLCALPVGSGPTAGGAHDQLRGGHCVPDWHFGPGQLVRA